MATTMSTNLVSPVRISKENYDFLKQYVHRTSGIVLDKDKEYLFEARLAPIVRKEKLKSFDELVSLIRGAGAGRISQEVVEAMTTNETLFFRDAIPFDALRTTLIPELLEKRRKSRKLSFWSAASASGQEAYSLAILLCEMGLEDWSIDILGTDLNEKMVERARAARYLPIEVSRGLPTAYLHKYFERCDLAWRLKDNIRRMARFRQFDLRQSLRQLGQFDFVLCRNVLIYFDAATKRRIFKELEAILSPGGYLLLGTAETTMSLSDTFERRAIEGASFYHKR